MTKKGCERCKDEEMKRIEELLQKRVKPQDCPFKETCEQIVLPEEAELFCKDQEVNQDAVSLHVAGRHVWEVCKVYIEKRRQVEGRKPREW